MRRIFFAVILMTAAFSYGIEAQAPASPTEQILLERLEVMEGQVSALRAELERLKTEIAKESKAIPAQEAAKAEEVANGDKGGAKDGAVDAGSKTSTAQAAQQIGISLGNNLKLIPYGTVYFNAFGNTSGTNNTDVPLWATSSDQSNSGASLRQTRFGVRVEGGRIGNSSLTGVVEADFYGGLPAVGVGENFGVVRLRVAKLKFDWEKTSLTVGQDWVVFAPLNPASIAAAAIPQFAASGNLWSRLPQVRVERKFSGGRFLFQGAVLAPTSGDFPSGPDSPFLLQPGAASRSGVPSFESRLAYTGKNWFGTGKPGSLAVSGHLGRAKVGSEGIPSYALALDWNFPLAKRIGITGEAFFGRNLGGLQGAIFQGYNPDYGVSQAGLSPPATVRGIRTSGGWAQVSFTPPVLRDRLSLYGSAGIDDPENDDLLSVTPRNWRARNLSYAFVVIFKPIPQLSIGGEFRRFHTTYFLTGDRDAGHINLGAAYSF